MLSGTGGRDEHVEIGPHGRRAADEPRGRRRWHWVRPHTALFAAVALTLNACGSPTLPIRLSLDAFELAIDTSSGTPHLKGTFDVRIYAEPTAPASYPGRDITFPVAPILIARAKHSLEPQMTASPAPPYHIVPQGRADVRFTLGASADRSGELLKGSDVDWLCDPSEGLDALVRTDVTNAEPEGGASISRSIWVGGCP